MSALVRQDQVSGDVFEPEVELVFHASEAVGLGRGEVIGFAGVVGEVVEFEGRGRGKLYLGIGVGDDAVFYKMLGLIHADFEPLDVGDVEGFGDVGTDEFPVAVAQGGVVFKARGVAVPLPGARWIVRGGLASENVGLVNAVEFEMGGAFDAGKAEEGGEPVAHVEEGIGFGAGGV